LGDYWLSNHRFIIFCIEDIDFEATQPERWG
jgi:hypothetical protein